MRADFARQVQQKQGFFKIHFTRSPALGQAGTRRLWLLFGRFSPLNIGTKPAFFQANFIPGILAQDAIARIISIAVHRPREATIWIIPASDKPPRARSF